MRIPRRHFLASSVTLASGLTMPMVFGARARAQSRLPPSEKLLFVVCAAGGGAVTESFMPVAASESAFASTLAVQPNSQVATVGNLRCVKNRGGTVAELPAGNAISQETFLQRHGADTTVIPIEGTSVNHRVAQKRSLTGAGVDGGRTILEAMAERYGAGMLLPNVNMGQDGYLEHGDAPTTPAWARTEPVRDAKLFAFQTDGSKGLADDDLRALLTKARRVRDEIDDDTHFGQTFKNATLRQRYLARRADIARMESANLVQELMFVPDDDLETPLGRYGLTRSSVADRVMEVFPKASIDPIEAQGALAFLLARAGTSTAIALSPSFQPELTGATIINTPLAFDFSHADHPGTQNVMWSRILAATDGLIRLLKEEPSDGVNVDNGTLWDRSLVYIATDFGRDKTRPNNASSWGTGHHLNNGHVIISPLIHGGRTFGGVDPDTLLTYGFDPVSGAPTPGSVMREADVYSILAGALGIDFDGRVDMPAVVRATS